MFGVDWGNAQTLGVNVTNLILGIVVLVLLGISAFGVAYDIMSHHHHH